MRFVLLLSATLAVGCASNAAAPSKAGTPAPGAVDHQAGVAWLTQCMAEASPCRTVAVRPDGRQIAVAHVPDDGGRGWTGFAVTVFEVRTNELVNTVTVLEPVEDYDAKGNSTRPEAAAEIRKTAPVFAGWAFEAPVPATLGPLPQPGDEQIYEAALAINGAAAQVSLPGRLICDNFEEADGDPLIGQMAFRGDRITAGTVAGGTIGVVLLDGGMYGDMCSMAAPPIWVGPI